MLEQALVRSLKPRKHFDNSDHGGNFSQLNRTQEQMLGSKSMGLGGSSSVDEATGGLVLHSHLQTYRQSEERAAEYSVVGDITPVGQNEVSNLRSS